MKQSLTIAFILVFSGLSAQVAFSDAVRIKNAAPGMRFNSAKNAYCLAQNAEVYKILKSYVGNNVDTSKKKSIEDDFDTNPFIFYCNKSLGGGSASGGSKSFFSSVGGLDVTKYVNAIADIMIERAKQELTVAFFDRFKKFADENPEFGILFPKTTDNLKNLLTYKYPQMLPALRTGFFEDLKQITYHLDDVLDLPRYQTLLKNFPEVRAAIRSVRLVHEIETGASNAAEIISEFAAFKEWEENNTMKNVGSCLKIGAFISESLRNDGNNETEDIWVSSKELKELYNDTTLYIYMGLLHQLSIKKNLQYIAPNGNPTKLSDLLANQKSNIFIFQNKVKEFADLSGNVNNAFKELKKKLDNGEKPSNDDVYSYINTSIDIVEYAFGIVKIFNENTAPDNYLAVARKSNDLYKSIYTKQYTQGVNNALDIFIMLNDLIKKQVEFNSVNDAVLPDSAEKVHKKAIARLRKGDQFLNRVTGEEIDDAVAIKSTDPKVEKLVEHYTLQKLIDFIQKVKPYALFMANMVEAEDEEEVKAALESVILPVGSSSIKKFTRNNISVQTYLGAFYTTSNRNGSMNGTWSDKWGVTAPVGISWTPGFLSWGKCGSLSLFGAFFDIGAIVDYRLRKEPDVTSSDPNATVTDKDYKIQLGQIFSPGLFAVYGAGLKLPISVGFGAQYGPGLSKVDVSIDPVVTNPSWRWNLFFAVDLPFFNIINKSKK